MHELLAPLIYVMYTECKVLENSKEELSGEICMILDINYLEHDA